MHDRRLRVPLFLLNTIAFALISAVLPAQMAAAAEQRCFRETGHCIEGRFLEYWLTNGGLPVFGYPLTSASREGDTELTPGVLTQWFERTRFESHPHNTRPYDVLLGRLGADQLRTRGGQPEAPGQQQRGCLWFAETQHAVCDQTTGVGFKSYWQSHGLSFDDQPGISYAESLALFGFPLTAPRMETNANGDRVLTQWFERARFEWHPGNPTASRVLLGLLGTEVEAPFQTFSHPGLPGRLLVGLVGADRRYAVQADGSRTTHAPPRSKPVATYCTTNGGLCLLNPDGSRTRLNNDHTASNMVLSPDGTRIAYVSANNAPGGRGFHIVKVDGTGDTLVMAGRPEKMHSAPIWSPDSQRIAFTTVGSENAIYVVNADGTQLRQIVEQGSQHAWSPDGTRIAFQAPTGNGDIYTINPEGTGLKQLTSSPAVESYPRWSPDSSRVSYGWDDPREPIPGGEGTPVAMYVMRADGSHPVELVRSEAGSGLASIVAWSPDNTYIAATHYTLCGVDCNSTPSQIWGARVDGTAQFVMVEGRGIGVLDWLR